MAKRVFFSFDYADVEMFRANVVRKHDLTKEDRDDAGFFDASIWETAQRTGVEAIKKLINAALENTSVTAALIGTDTWSRRWVRYEIFKSMERGNRIFGVHINGIKDKDQSTKPYGANPFEYLGRGYSSDGTMLELFEWSQGRAWEKYPDLSGYKLENQRQRQDWGQFYQLSKYYQVYDWIANDGYNNFASWVGA
jgi:MTH538 TIR-like domain (DUF1863)